MRTKVAVLEQEVATLRARPARDLIGEAVNLMSQNDLHNQFDLAIQARFRRNDNDNHNAKIVDERLEEIAKNPNGISFNGVL